MEKIGKYGTKENLGDLTCDCGSRAFKIVRSKCRDKFLGKTMEWFGCKFICHNCGKDWSIPISRGEATYTPEQPVRILRAEK